MLWFWMALAAGLMWGVCATSDKYFLTHYVKEPLLLPLLLNLANLMATPIIFVFADVGFHLPYSVLSYFRGMITFVGFSLYFMAMKKSDASRVIALHNTMPLFVLLMATFLFGEVFLPLTYLGIFLIVAGAVMVSWKGFSRTGVVYVLLMTVLLGTNSLFSKFLVQFISPWEILFYSIFGYLTLSLIFYRKYWPGFQKWMIPFGLAAWLGLAGHAIYITAMGIGTVSLVASLVATEPLWVLIFATAMSWKGHLHEHVHWKAVGVKLAAIVLIIAGVYFIS